MFIIFQKQGVYVNNESCISLGLVVKSAHFLSGFSKNLKRLM